MLYPPRMAPLPASLLMIVTVLVTRFEVVRQHCRCHHVNIDSFVSGEPLAHLWQAEQQSAQVFVAHGLDGSTARHRLHKIFVRLADIVKECCYTQVEQKSLSII